MQKIISFFYLSLLLTALILCETAPCSAQDQHTLDSLNALLKNAKEDTGKVNLLLSIGGEYEEPMPEKAADYYSQGLAVARKINEKLSIATCLDYLGYVYKNLLVKYETAEPYYLECLKIRKEVLGDTHADYSITLNNLAQLYQDEGNYPKAESYYLQVSKIYKETLGEKNPDYATSLNNLGEIYQAMGNYSKAEPFYIKSSKIWKDALGKKNRYYAASLKCLASLYYAMCDYSEAEPLYIESAEIYKEVLGEKNPYYANALNGLAGLYQDLGNYAKAEKIMIEVLKITKESLGEKHPYYASSLSNLAGLYMDMGNYTRAEPLFIKSMEIDKEVLGIHHPVYASALNALGTLYKYMGNYTKAEPLLLEALKIRKETLGEKHPLYALSLNNLGKLYVAMKLYSKAKPLYTESLNIYREIDGEKQEYDALVMNNLAGLYKDTKLLAKAEQFYLGALDICFINMQSNFSTMSENEKEKYVATNTGNFSEFYDFAFKYKKEKPAITGVAYNLALTTKGIILSSSNRIRDEINSSGDTALISLFNKWRVLKEEIGRYSQWDKEKLQKMNLKPDSLENLANDMEKRLSLKSNAFSNERKNSQVTWKQMQQKLDNKSAAVEFITYNLHDTKEHIIPDTTMYCALVLRKDDKTPQMLSLCNNYELAALLEKTKLYATTAQVKGIKPMINNYVDDESASQDLFKLIWLPLDSLLAGKEKVFVSLTGILNKVSFDALMDDKKQLLLNKYDLCFVNSTRQLATEDIVKKLPNQNVALFGGIIYDADSTLMKQHAKGTGIKNDDLAMRTNPGDTSRNNTWPYLGGTLTEVNNINDVFSSHKWNTKVYTGNDATEENFKNLYGKNSPAILHISTHGFFFPEPDSATISHTQNKFKILKSPLFRSGVLMAGANYTWKCNPEMEGVEDGVLTAYEVANGNLKNTDLVVLSACETGLGDIKTGEGVYGLQRAFQVAGAKSVIMSLWQVPDKETTELMTLFYESYIKTQNKHESFRKAQQAMAKKYEPYYWAAFVLVE